MNPRPSFQFYPRDWLNHPGLKLCSLAARGLLMDLMCLMHDGEPYGHLQMHGQVLGVEEIAALLGRKPREVRRLLDEILSKKLLETGPENVLFSPRMVRDEHIRNVRAAAGKKGGNPALVGTASDTGKDNLLHNQNGKQKPTPSSSSSSSPSSIKTPSSTPPEAGDGAAAPDPREGGREVLEKGLEERQQQPIQHEERIPERVWLCPDDRPVPLPKRAALLEEAHELVRTGKSETLGGGVQYAVKRDYNARQRSGNRAGSYTPDRWEYIPPEKSEHPVFVAERHERQKERARHGS